jgi:predicted PurR-regulated permease PerM
MDNNNKKLYRPFLIFLVAAVLIACFLVFRPFLIELAIAVIMASVLYGPYLRLTRWLKGRRKTAALIICVLTVLLIILPLTEFVIYTAQRSVDAYKQMGDLSAQYDNLFQTGPLSHLKDFGLDTVSTKKFVVDSINSSGNWMISVGTSIVTGTIGFFLSLVLIVLALFFFLVDGEKMMKHVMLWSPLPDVYNLMIFRKFRAVSYSTMMSTFVTAAAQGLVGGIGFAFVGFPALFCGILIAVFSLLPYVGSAIFYVPASLYLMATNHIGQGIFVLLWGTIIVSNIDNVLRTYMINGKAGVNPIFIFFSIIGGVTLFGFWGVVLGPLAVSLAVTILYIYEKEFAKDLLANSDLTAKELKEIELAEHEVEEKDETIELKNMEKASKQD